MSEELVCSRCGGRMEAGFMLDRGHYGVPQATAEWVEGEPERSIWTGIKTKGREHYRVETYRCEGCGRLDSYARELLK
jgi:hypothetical protein